MLHKCLVVFALFISALTNAQDLTGIWRGTFYNETELLFTGARYRYEVQIKNTGQSIKGVTYSYQNTRFYGKASLVGRWAPSTGDLTLKEDKMLDLKVTDGGEGCLMTCYLEYRKESGHELLVGTYTSVNMKNDSISCGGGVVRLEKVFDSDFKKEDFLENKTSSSTSKTGSPKSGVKPGQNEFLLNKGAVTNNNSKPKTNSTPTPNNKPSIKQTPAKPSTSKEINPNTAKQTTPQKPIVPPTPPVVKSTSPQTKEIAKETKPMSKPLAPLAIKNRKNELVESISTSSKELEISFYDNGEIDGDTISVYDNNAIVVSKKGLSAEPITIKVHFEDTELDHEITMVAENLGSIPPNTALMIVKAGDQRYTLRLASTEQKNAVVRFRYNPDSVN